MMQHLFKGQKSYKKSILNHLKSSFSEANSVLKTRITEQSVKKFAEVSGDTNPLHIDKEYAQKSIFKQRISHGMLPMGFIDQYLNQRGMTVKKMQIKFIRPIYLQEEISVEIKIQNQDQENKGALQFYAEIRKQSASISQSDSINSDSNLIVTTITGSVEKQQ